MGGNFCDYLHGLKPVGVMVLVQIVFAGVNVFYKLAISDGMSLRILVAYRYIFGTIILGPLAFFLERSTRPAMTWTVLLQAFFCGLFGGSLAQNLYVGALSMTSATFVSAMTNLIPAITFIMAVSCGLERLGVRTLAGQAKILGTVIGISGAMLLTFYKGSEIKPWTTHINLVDHYHHQINGRHASGNRVMGSLLAVISCFSYAIWLIIQTKMSERYPAHYSSTALMCLMGSIQATVFALCVERDWAQWKLGWNIRLLTVAYSGGLASGLIVTLIAWCIRRKGPLFVSVFNPLMLVMVALAGSLVLNEKLHLGSAIGAALIIVGLYVVLWGKGKEIRDSVHLPVKTPENSIRATASEAPVSKTVDNNSARSSESKSKEEVLVSARSSVKTPENSIRATASKAPVSKTGDTSSPRSSESKSKEEVLVSARSSVTTPENSLRATASKAPVSKTGDNSSPRSSESKSKEEVLVSARSSVKTPENSVKPPASETEHNSSATSPESKSNEEVVVSVLAVER